MLPFRLSPRWGLNPGPIACRVCHKPNGLRLFGQIDEDDSRAPERAIEDDGDPCPVCLHQMRRGVLAVEVFDGLSRRTGRTFLVSDEQAARLATPEIADRILADRFFVIDREAFCRLAEC